MVGKREWTVQRNHWYWPTKDECSFRTRFQLPEVKSTTWDERISIPDSKCHYMISPTNHDSCRFLFCIFELFLSHFNAQLNHFPSVDAMLHRCKALPEALLSRTCTVLGSAECSCEVVQSQSWSRVIVVSAAIDFSVVQLFSIFFPAIFWQLFNWLENRPVSSAGEPSCRPRLMFFQSAKWKIYENCNVW